MHKLAWDESISFITGHARNPTVTKSMPLPVIDVSINDTQPERFHNLLHLSIYQEISANGQGRVIGSIQNEILHQPHRNSRGGPGPALQPQR
jgi:hypothetical protein